MENKFEKLLSRCEQKLREVAPKERTVKEILDSEELAPYLPTAQEPFAIHKDPKETTTINYNQFSVFQQNSKYIPPIELVTKGIMHQANEMLDNKIHNEIVLQYGVFVDKEELVKALNYDRGQYRKGWIDGYNEAIKKEIKTNFDRITESEEVLAAFIVNNTSNCYHCFLGIDGKCEFALKYLGDEACLQSIKEWLQKECEE